MIVQLFPLWPLFLGMLVFVAIGIIADLLVHPLRRELMQVGEDILSRPSLTKRDRDGVEHMLAESTSSLNGLFFIFGSLVFLFLAITRKLNFVPALETVPSEIRSRFTKLSLISDFAANPIAGIIWLPIFYLVVLVKSKKSPTHGEIFMLEQSAGLARSWSVLT